MRLRSWLRLLRNGTRIRSKEKRQLRIYTSCLPARILNDIARRGKSPTPADKGTRFRLEIFVVKQLVHPVIRHHAVDVILRLAKRDLGDVPLRNTRPRAGQPAF